MASPPPTPQSLTDTSDLSHVDVPPEHHALCPQLSPQHLRRLINSWHWD